MSGRDCYTTAGKCFRNKLKMNKQIDQKHVQGFTSVNLNALQTSVFLSRSTVKKTGILNFIF